MNNFRNCFYIFSALYFSISSNGQVLTPPYFNLAEGRRINATYTCGVPDPELYCTLIGANPDKYPEREENLILGQFCDRCDASIPEKSHPAEYAVDGRDTWWQSPPLSRGMEYNEVNLTIDLGQEFHVAYVIVKMGNSPRPDVWALERSNDYGLTYSPWEYFASSEGDCKQYFGLNVSFHITSDDTVICNKEYSHIVPLEGGEIVVPLVQNRPSAKDFFNSPVLQEWTRATNVRFRLLKVKNLLAHLMNIGRQDPTLTRRYFYSIKDISIGGRCRCFGHADTCTSIDRNDPYKLVCDCKDNTCGHNCEICCPGFEQKKWSLSKNNKRFVCERCNCFGHSNQCIYNETIDNQKESIDMHGNYEGGGVCQNCQHNTEGINCNKCKPGFYRPHGKKFEDIDVCQHCKCDFFYSTGNCADGSGQCECKPEYTKPNCDKCSFGHYGYPLCRRCECFLNGTTSLQCEPQNGLCFCQSNYGGPFCSTCADGFYDFPECKTCDCNGDGSLSNICDPNSGTCSCKPSFGGRTCDQCANGYYSFPSCSYCNCDVKGTVAEICNKTNGQCICKPGYGGPRCDQCSANFTGFPDCKPCNCSTIGSAFSICDITGKCTCLPNYAGKLCDQCYPGYYQYPNCLPCNCNPEGSEGISCINNGTCKCKPNFDGDKCNDCKEGYYNFPICEECNFNPAGVVASFTGCSSLEPGQMLAFQCKPHVEGKICNECRELYWNLQPSNPEGCEDCNCNRSGTIGRIGACDSKTGQCICKPSTKSRKCDKCENGFYDLTDNNLFGCTECNCDIGASVHDNCDKKTGRCTCLPRITGRDCKEPVDAHFFPTLHQYQYEIEDGHTYTSSPIRFGFDEKYFPNYSWRGYGIFSHLQNEIIHNVMIDKSSIYRMVLYYVNRNLQSVSGTISVVPEESNNIDTEQKFQVLFKPTQNPSFVTVSGLTGNSPSPFVLNPGPWSIKIKIDKDLFVDYFVLIPAEYYEASLLVSNVTTPCTIDSLKLCRNYQYPNVSLFDQVKGSGIYLNEGGNRSPIKYHLDDFKDTINGPRMPLLSDSQPELYVDMRITKPGLYILVIDYATVENQNSTNIEIEARSQNTGGKGIATVYNCRYIMLCRQLVLDREGKAAQFNFDSNFINIIMKGVGNGIGIDSVMAIPIEKWSLDYVRPKSYCVMNDNKCISSKYFTPPDSKRFDFKWNEIGTNQTAPNVMFDDASQLIYLDYRNPMIDVNGKVPKPGQYVFVVHYYQPDFPEFDMDALVHNGQTYEAKLPVQHCPSVTGCRSIIRQANGNHVFQLSENFVLSLKEPDHKSIWVSYVLAIPNSQFTFDVIPEQPFDQTTMFISQCGFNHFYLDTSLDGFCREATYSLTTKYNHGALPCECDFDGSLSFSCAKFGGQCQCKENVIGRRCDSCKTGHFGFPDCKPCECTTTAVCDQNTGECICPVNVIGEKCDRCKPFTYGFDIIVGCDNCDCHVYGVENRNMQCNVTNGNCDCKENVEGRKCDRCVAGHYSFPYCRECECDLRGTTEEICDQSSAACMCKSNVLGSACDVCKDGTFNLQSDNSEGCTKCFCFGKTSRCSSSSLYMSALSELENWTLANVNISKNVEVNPLPSNNIEKNQNSISVNFAFILEGITYFVAPSKYLKNKLRSYGGYLNYTVHYTVLESANAVAAPDVIFYGANMYLMHTSVEQPVEATYFPFSVKIIEQNFVTISGSTATREELMQVLQNLTAIYIKSSFSEKNKETQLLSVMLDVAGHEYSSNLALSVEQCHCPQSYVGLSCEECADGFYRVSAGPFGGYCIPCQCNGHAPTCDKATGVCHNCKHNTKGDHCEKCEMGYYGNATGGTPSDCLICACPLPKQSNNFATGCEISESGDEIICDCLPGYTGKRCERCGPGHYGNPDNDGQVCSYCNCNGNIDPSDPYACDHLSGKCINCLNNTSGDSCEICAPGYFGDAIDLKNCQPCNCDKCGTKECDHNTGQCICHENVVGEKCDSCALQHFGFTTCQGCRPCNCDVASNSFQCDDLTGHCKCKEGVVGRSCDRCAPGYWQYTDLGCKSCGCNTDYSVGVGCNSTTGLCQCLPRVLGDQCNQCPYRNVLIPEQGCIECNNCTHRLLDVTDELNSIFTSNFSKFKTTPIGYFTKQRLLLINNTANQLATSVSDLHSYQFDLKPYNDKITDIEKEAETSLRIIRSTSNDILSAAMKGDLVYADALQVEDLINKEVGKWIMTVTEIQNLVYSLEAGAISRTDYAIYYGKNILNNINNLSLDQEILDDANNVTETSGNILNKVIDFIPPVIKSAKNLDDLENKISLFTNILEELKTFTNEAQKKIDEVTKLNEHLNKLKLKEKIKSIENSYKNVVNEMIQETSSLLNNASSDLDVAALNFINLNNNNLKLKTIHDQALESIKQLLSENSELRKSVKDAKAHANNLKAQANLLESSIKKHDFNEALQAANAYNNIESAINNSSSALSEAIEAADNAVEKSKAIDENAPLSSSKSQNLLNVARSTLTDVQQNLAPELSLTLQKQNNISKIINQTSDGVDSIYKQLESRRKEDNIANKLGNLKPDEISQRAQETLNKMKSLSDYAEKLTQAEQLYADRDSKRKSIQQAKTFVDNVEKDIPKIEDYINKLRNLPQEKINITDMIEKLKEKIAVTRDLASKIKVGVTLDRHGSLELPIPESMLNQGSRTDISLYFKTDQPNGLLFYIGNEKIPHRKRETTSYIQEIRRPKPSDFVALEIVNGYPLLSIDLGEGVTKVSKIQKYIADNKWYHIKFERIGKLFNLTIREEAKTPVKTVKSYFGSEHLAGIHSVLNLDKDSKFFIGGIPSSFDSPPAVNYHTFSGQVEELSIDGEPVGLWNFVNVSTYASGAPASTVINGSIERDVLLMSESSSGCRFNGEGYIVLSTKSLRLKDQTDVTLRFKTAFPEGLLFLIFKDDTFLSIELINGFIFCKYNLGRNLVSLKTDLTYNDDEWHKIGVTISYSDGVLIVDGEKIRHSSGEKDLSLKMPDYIYIGGYPGNHGIKSVTNVSFDGCVDSIQIEQAPVDINNNLNARGITPGCPKRHSRYASFDGGSHAYVRKSGIEVHNDIQIHFRFKTALSSSILAFGTDGYNSFYISLMDGEIVFNSGNQQVKSINSGLRYNDKHWHTIFVTITNSNELNLMIDDNNEFKSSENHSSSKRILSPITVYFASVPSNIDAEISYNLHSFSGCIGDVTINDIIINFDEMENKEATIGRCDEHGISSTAKSTVSKPTYPTSTSTSAPTTTPQPAITVGPKTLPIVPQNDPDVTEESGIRLGTAKQSYLVYDISKKIDEYENNRRLEFSVLVKTVSRDGIILFAHLMEDFTILYLKDAALHLNISCMKNSISLTSDTNILNGEWHNIIIKLEPKQAILMVDGKPAKTSNIGCVRIMPKIYYIGSSYNITSENADKLSKDVNKSFVGCIQKFKVNNNEIKALESIGVIPCSGKVELGTFFFVERGALYTNEKFKVGKKLDIKMDIKPRNSSGLLLAVHGHKDYAILQLIDGALKFTIESGNGPVYALFKPSTSNYFIDNEWHSINAYKDKNIVVLTVDNSILSPSFDDPRGQFSTDTNRPLYIGGYPPEELNKINLRGIETTTQYVGCIKNFELNMIQQDLSNFNVSGKVRLNVCPTI